MTTRTIVPLAIPMALGLALGMVLALSGGPPVTTITQAARGANPDPSASPTPSAHAASAQPANTDCSLIVPARPLTAAGLATPWLLTGPDGQDPAASGCRQSNPDLSAFVQATILDPATGQLSVYEPLVITLGTNPAAAPVVPRLPRRAVVNIMVGFNGGNLRLIDDQPGTLSQAHCVNGDGDSLFGQVSYCNSVAFYAAARADMAFGRLRVPASGTSPVTGQRCPTTRSFQLVDQDQSDNVTTEYLLTASGQTAQVNAANRSALPGATVISNGSDNALLDNFVLPALGCAPFTAPDLSADGTRGTSQTLDELSAARNQRPPVALVPENDPMVLVNGKFSARKTGLYRLGVDQSLAGWQRTGAPAGYCASMLDIQTPFIAANARRFAAVASPVPATGNNLFTFLAARLSASFTNLDCGKFGLRNTVNLRTDANGVAVAATFNLTVQEP
ncbi:MAG TPA: hypothetical protein VFB06_13265 [Streptosporangiaceae bacterium]|nr:hypothetical protein [Streptosporangiaceae bacterium]